MAVAPVVMMAMMAASTALSAYGAISAGNAQKASAKSQAQQMEAQAVQEQASAQRAAIGDRKDAELLMSRARAVGAASGGGVDFERIGDIAQEGEYRALSSLFSGEDRALGLQADASAARISGANAAKAGYLNAASTVLSNGSSMMMKYGGGSSAGGSSKNKVA